MPPGQLGEGLVRALQDALRADLNPAARRHLAVHRQAAVFQIAEFLQVAHAGTIRALAMMTRGAQGCVRKTATGFPDCTTRVSSCSSRCSVATMASKAVQAARGAARSAVDDEIVGTFGDLGVEVVHQHAKRGFLRPSLAGDRRASRRADMAAEGAHRAEVCVVVFGAPKSIDRRRTRAEGSNLKNNRARCQFETEKFLT